MIINEQTDPILGITILIALITLGGIIWSNLQTKKSNELLTKDIHSRIRPWIVLGETSPRQIFFEDGLYDIITTGQKIHKIFLQI